MLQFGLRLGRNPRCLVATTPRPTKLIRELLAQEGRGVAVTRGSTYENRANLAPGFVLLTPRGLSSQIACGSWLSMSLSNGTVTSYGKVMSTFPARKASSAVERLGIIVHSMPSR